MSQHKGLTSYNMFPWLPLASGDSTSLLLVFPDTSLASFTSHIMTHQLLSSVPPK